MKEELAALKNKSHEEVLKRDIENMETNDKNTNDVKEELSSVIEKLNNNESKIVSLNSEYAELLKTKNTVDCFHCDNKFLSKKDLEQHLLSVNCEKTFKCDQCSKLFHTKWRMEKHKTIHNNPEKIRKCYYFNSGKSCPYEVLGCKFRHELSEKCKNGQNCEFHKCQYRH